MQIRTLMTLFLAASLGALVTGCERSDTGITQPQSRTDSLMRQGAAPAAPTQGSEDSVAGKASSSTAAAPAQSPDSSAMASPADERTKSDDAAKQKGSS